MISTPLVDILSIDGESNGLGGLVFALGACHCVWDTERKEPRILRRFLGVTAPPLVVDDWVKKNVMPVLPPPNYHNRLTLFRGFWAWTEESLASCARILVHVGFPVEARIVTELVESDPERAWQLNPPVLDLSNFMIAAGMDGFNAPSEPLARETWGPVRWDEHNPQHDAEITAGAFYTLLRRNPSWAASKSLQPKTE